MFVATSGLDLYGRPRRYSVTRPENAARVSIVSSDASSLHRTSSTASNTSAASSISSAEASPKSQHRRSVSGSSFHLPKALQPFHKKALSHSHVQGQSQSEFDPKSQSQPTSPQSPKPPPNRLRRPPPQAHQNTKVRSYSSPVPPRSLPTLPLPPPPPPPTRPRQPPPRPRRPSQEELRWKEPLVTLSSTQPKPRRILEEEPQQKEAPVTQPSSPAMQWQCSDLVVRCKGDVYHVDRTIMCYHSKWFSRICAIMRHSKASKNVIDLSADDPEAVAAMMQYCYQLNYDCKSAESLEIDEIADLRPHVDIYMLAERYGISGLKQLALEKFENLAITVLTVNGSERHLLRAVRAIYEPSRRANADELRHVAITICANHVEGFIAGDQTQMALVFESMDELPEFRTDLFEEMALRWK